MSNIGVNLINKFSKWLTVKKEIQFDKVLEKLDNTKDDYNLMLSKVNSDHSAWLEKMHVRHQVVEIILLGVGIFSAIVGLGVFT